MCMGLPMKVVEAGFGYAICEDRGTSRHIDTMLVGDVSPGDWLLVFIDAARDVISEEEAQKIGDALRAVEQIMSGQFNPDDTEDSGQTAFDHLFADLIKSPDASSKA
nr:HypC/HybG/HupF family hydrogenase formation chaperone [uncultured Cohaesibacter sp.]